MIELPFLLLGMLEASRFLPFELTGDLIGRDGEANAAGRAKRGDLTACWRILGRVLLGVWDPEAIGGFQSESAVLSDALVEVAEDGLNGVSADAKGSLSSCCFRYWEN